MNKIQYLLARQAFMISNTTVATSLKLTQRPQNPLVSNKAHSKKRKTTNNTQQQIKQKHKARTRQSGHCATKRVGNSAGPGTNENNAPHCLFEQLIESAANRCCTSSNSKRLRTFDLASNNLHTSSYVNTPCTHACVNNKTSKVQ